MCRIILVSSHMARYHRKYERYIRFYSISMYLQHPSTSKGRGKLYKECNHNPYKHQNPQPAKGLSPGSSSIHSSSGLGKAGSIGQVWSLFPPGIPTQVSMPRVPALQVSMTVCKVSISQPATKSAWELNPVRSPRRVGSVHPVSTCRRIAGCHSRLHRTYAGSASTPQGSPAFHPHPWWGMPCCSGSLPDRLRGCNRKAL